MTSSKVYIVVLATAATSACSSDDADIRGSRLSQSGVSGSSGGTLEVGTSGTSSGGTSSNIASGAGNGGYDPSPIGGAAGRDGPGADNALASCVAMDASSSGDDCTEVAGYAFDGSTCVEITCGCKGTDCDHLYAELRACDAAYVHCQPRTGELLAACDDDADCEEDAGCLSHTCGRSCSSDAECTETEGCFEEGSSRPCPILEAVYPPTGHVGQCLPRCSMDTDCRTLGAALTCRTGACVRAQPDCELACPRVASSCSTGCREITASVYDTARRCLVAEAAVFGCEPDWDAILLEPECAVSEDGYWVVAERGDMGHIITSQAGYTSCPQPWMNPLYDEPFSPNCD